MGRGITNNVTHGTSDNNIMPEVVTNAAGEIVAYTDANGFHEIRYRDEYTSGDWTTPSGSSAPDTVSITIGGFVTTVTAFDGNTTTEVKSNEFEIAHDLPIDAINSGMLKIEAHAHCSPSTNNAGNVKWHFEWIYKPVNAAPISMTTLTFIVEVAANQQYWHLLGGVELPIPAGGYHIGDIIKFNIKRIPTDGDDTYANDIYLDKVALHVPTDGNGSRQRYIK